MVSNIRLVINFIFLIILITGPFVLLWLPKTFFDEGKSVCISILLFHTSCYGCGMTRAIQHLIHLDFKGAWQYNKLSFIVLPILSILVIKEIFRIKKMFRFIN